MNAHGTRLGLGALLAAAVLAACGSTPSPSVVPSPSVMPTTSTASPVRTPGETVRCVPETGPVPSGPPGDPCPSAIAAVRSVVEPLGLAIVRIDIEAGPFVCGDLWPGIGSPSVCPMPYIVPGTAMHGWVSFSGTNKVAVVLLYRELPRGTSPSPAPPWTATLVVFRLPPAGWVMP